MRVRVSGLDTSWDGGNRGAHFYIRAGRNPTISAYDDYDYTTISGAPSSSSYLTFSRLDSGTHYYVMCVIKTSSGSTLTTLYEDDWTDEEIIDYPYFSVSDVTENTAYINISNLSDSFNKSYYTGAGVTTGYFTSQGASSVPGTILGTKEAPSSGGGNYTGFQIANLKAGATYTVYPYVRSTNGLYYAIRRSQTSDVYGISFTTTAASHPGNWTWTSAELTAFQNKGRMDSITYTRWNSFIDRVNAFVIYVNKKQSSSYSQISSSCKMTSTNKHLYANSFNQIVQVVKNIAGYSSTTIPTTLKKDDPVYGWYFPSLSGAINSIT